MENLSEDRIINDRLEKLQKIKKLNIDPYPNRWDNNRIKIIDAIASFDLNEKTNKPQSNLSLAGRILAKRGMGKVIFFDLKDQSGKIQLHFKQEERKISKDFLS